MLSLDKTKELAQVQEFLGNQDFLAMPKLDGLTCSLKYVNGALVSAETRGNGEVGEDITHNAKVVTSIPQYINYFEELVVDGEIICKYNDFKPEEGYKNPRNFASGSIRLLDSKECAKRNLSFIAWDLIKGKDELTLFTERLNFLQDLGFEVVPWIQKEPINAINDLKDYCSNYPLDGIVFKFNNVVYGKSLGNTSHHFKNAIAYKFYDEEYESELLDIEWSIGRTGILTPVAIFNPIDIDGSEVEKASLHNVSVMRQTLGNPYYGQKVWVVKQNAIIPQIVKAEQNYTEEKAIPFLMECPICGSNLEIRKDNDSTFLMCINPDCEGKFVNRLNHFCSKNGLDIQGFSKIILDKLISFGWINNIIDLFYLSNHRNEWIQKAGFGPKSVDNLLSAIEESKNCKLENFIAALGIPLIGKNVAADICKKVNSYEEFRQLIDSNFDFSSWTSFGQAKSNALLNFDYTEADQIFQLLSIEEKPQASQLFANKKFVITGSVHQFKSRAELKSYIEDNGGKVLSAVSKNVDYLINNDTTSTSTKNLTAQKLNIPIISEKEFLELTF